ncbi:hypothetical protein C0Q70_04756 [Pomacea canaliculata]|uniref:SOCS box domain-containing protein n=1 Tax=Pomacea canaliculata TaxID=400727 RepID=A0A2T7PJD0_POMCA|nr:hypothetical protein C0Q70_04756 [Pomacea canaliculata]
MATYTHLKYSSRFLKQVIKNGAKLETKDFEENTAAQVAVKCKNWSYVKQLKDEGADFDFVNSDNQRSMACDWVASGEMPQDVLSVFSPRESNRISSFSSFISSDPNPLDEAVENKNWEYVKQRVKKNIRIINNPDKNGYTLLHKIAQVRADKSLENVLCFLLNRSADVTVRTPNGESLLHLAARHENWLVVKIVLENRHKIKTNGSADYLGINIPDSQGLNILHRLAQTNQRNYRYLPNKGREDELTLLVPTLLQYVTDVSVPSEAGDTAIHLAAKSGNWKMVQTIASIYAQQRKPLSELDREGFNILHRLTKFKVTHKKKVQILKVLFQAGLNLDCKCKHGETALQMAVKQEQWKFARALVTLGADVHERDPGGRHILQMIATQNISDDQIDGCISFITLLNQSDVDFNVRCPNGDSFFQLAARHGNWQILEKVVVHVTLDIKDVDTKDDEGFTVLQRLASSESAYHIHLLQFLLEKGARCDTLNFRGDSAMHLAAEKNNWYIIEQLLASETKPHSDPTTAETDCQIGDTSACKHILHTTDTDGAGRAHFDIDLKDHSGNTVLYLSAKKGKWDLVHKLLMLGSDATLTDDKGHTVMYWLAAEDHATIANDRQRKKVLQCLKISSPNGLTPVWLAVIKRKWSIVEFLLLCEATVPINTPYLFHELAKDTSVDAVLATTITSQLVRRGLNINEMTGDTPLNLAAKYQNWKVVRAFLEHGADASIVDSEGLFVCHRLLMDSGQSNFSEVNHFIYLMTKNGFDINQASRAGQNALQLALQRDEWKIFWCLVQYGASYRFLFCRKKNILENVFQCPRQMIKADNVKKFMLYVTDKDLFSRNGQNEIEMLKRKALIKCLSQYNWPVATVLVQCGVDISSSVEGKPLLHYVLFKYERQDHEMWLSFLDALLARGLDINCENGDGRTVLFYHDVYCSAECSNDDFNLLFHALIDRGANPLHTPRAGISLFRHYLNLEDTVGITLLKLLVQTGKLTIQARLTKPFKPRAATRSSCQQTSECSLTKIAFDTKKVFAFKLLVESGASSNKELVELATRTESTLNSKTRKDGRMLEVLCQAAHQPRSLKSLCRLTVLEAVGYGPQRIHRLMALPIPLLLKKYFLFSDITLEDQDLEGQKEKF